MIWKYAGLVAVLSAFGSIAAFAQTLPPDIAKSKVVKAATSGGYPPLEIKDPKSNEMVGFDIDLNNALAKELGLKVEYQESSFEQMTPSLKTGRVDLIISGFYDTPTRRDAGFDFIDYLTAGAQFYKKKSSTDIKTTADLCGKTVSVERGTSFADTVKAWGVKNCAGKAAVTVIIDDGLGQQLANLKQGRAEAAVQGLEAVPTIAEMDGNGYERLGEPLNATLMGIAFNKNDSTLRDSYVGALKKMIASGDYTALVKKWKLGLSSYTEVSINKGLAP